MKQRILLLGLAFLCVGSLARAEDWPQFRGPDRNGVSKETGLLKSWPKGGPKLLWTYQNAGLGYSSCAIVGDVLYTMGGFEKEEYVLALDLKKEGKELWRAKVGPLFQFEKWGDGPRGTPTVDGKHLYALGGQGVLVCVDITKGTVLWKKDLVKDLGGEMMTDWGFSESPLVDGNKVICTPGSKQGTLTALDKATGEVIWRSKELSNKASYSSVMVNEVGKQRQYVQTSYVDDSAGGVVSGIAAEDGRLLWSYSLFKEDSFAIAPNPILRGNQVFVSFGYKNIGSHLLELTPQGKTFDVKNLYSAKNQKNMRNIHGGVVLVGDHLYGHSEGKGWMCTEFQSGKDEWLERNQLKCRSGSLVAAEGHLYLYSEEGGVVLLEANPKSWQEKGDFEIPMKSQLRKSYPQAQIWAHPVIANGRLYLRDQELLFCYEIREKK